MVQHCISNDRHVTVRTNLSHSHNSTLWTWIKPHLFSGCDPSCGSHPFRTVLTSWLSGAAPWLPLRCTLLRWENKVGGNLRRSCKQSRSFIQRWLYFFLFFFPCDNNKDVYVRTPRSWKASDENMGRKNLDGSGTWHFPLEQWLWHLMTNHPADRFFFLSKISGECLQPKKVI